MENDSLSKINFVIHILCTLTMLGIIWFVQRVHYPLFKMVDPVNFAPYAQAHSRLITLIVGPLMIAELVTGIVLTQLRPEGLASSLVWLGLALIIVIWLSTFFLQVPQHQVLSDGFDELAHRQLVHTNWIRTVAWSIRGGLVIWMLFRVLGRTR